MSRYVIFTIVLGVLLLTPGCATMSNVVATDSFCLTAKKRMWSVNDRSEAIREARIHNQVVDARCGVPGKAAA